MMSFVFIALIVLLGILGGSFMFLVWYLRLVTRATITGKSWVRTVPRVAFPLFLGNLLTHLLFGSDQLALEMNQWYLVLNIASVVLVGVAVAHLTIRRRIITGETIVLSVFALAVSVVVASLLTAWV